MEVDFSDVWRTWVNTESVKVTSRRDNGNLVDVVDNVMRRALTGKEMAASNGTYTSDDVAFIAHRVKLQGLILQQRLPKPGDLIDVDDGQQFTVLNIDGLMRDRNGHQVYRLTTRNLALAYDLRDTVDIEAPTITLDNAGVKRKTWPPGAGSIPYRRLPAKVQMLSQDVMSERGLVGFRGTHAVIVGRQVRIDMEWRLKWDDGGTVRYLDLVDLKNPDRVDELPVIGAELRP